MGLMMVGRAFLDALKFGGPGGAVLGLALFGWLAAADPGTSRMGAPELVLPTLSVTALGVVAGSVLAYAALVVASIAADLVARASGLDVRIAGAGVALATTFAALAGVNLLNGMNPGAWSLLPPLAVGGYAAIVAWFRVPKILAR